MRRMNGRSPPFVIVGLLLICVILAYNYWTLSSQNRDLRKEIDNLQADVKISGAKQDHFEKKNHVLQTNVHDLSEKSQRLQQQIEREDQQLKNAQNLVQEKEHEITSLKSTLVKKESKEKELLQQIEDKDGKIEELVSESQKIITLKNDAEEALSEKDSLINDLKRQLDQAKSVRTEFEAQVKSLKNEYNKLKAQSGSLHQDTVVKPNPVPGIMNLQNMAKQEPYLSHGSLDYVPKMAVVTRDKGLQGMKFQPGQPILPLQSPNAKRAKPRFSVADIGVEPRDLAAQIQQPAVQDNGHFYAASNVIPNPPLLKDSESVLLHPAVEELNRHSGAMNKPLVAPMPQLHGMRRPPVPLDLHADLRENRNLGEEANVLPQPPQNPDENLDAAHDEEGRPVEDPLDDQDEEGKELKKGPQNYPEEEEEAYAGGLRKPDRDPLFGPDPRRYEGPGGNVEEDTENKANERVVESNIESKFAHLGRRHL